MSFILDKKIDNNNYKDYISIVKNYVLEKYPNLLELDISDIDNLEDKSKEYGINHFYFNRIDNDIEDLKYVKGKEKIKKFQLNS